jgi:hypothetical protein
MSNWRNIKIEGVTGICKCVAEFDVWAVQKAPYAKFKIKVFEDAEGKYIGYTNLRVKSLKDGSPEGGIGFGASVDEALGDTLQYFMNMINERPSELTEEDIKYSDPCDF